MNDTYAAERYRQACGFLPTSLRQAALAVSGAEQAAAEELRLRRALYLTTPSGERKIPGARVEPQDLEHVLDTVTGYSRYTAAATIPQGFLTAQGGFRVGLCGTAIMENGVVKGFRDLSSLSIRIPREQTGLADQVMPSLWREGRFLSTLIISPPGGGKTTLLRDLVRSLSDDRGLRVSLVDERGALAAVYQGRPQLLVGLHTDVMDACPKAAAIPALLRAMNPQVIAVDEVALQRDVEAMERAANAGAALLATVHGESVQELWRKPLFAGLLELGVFRRAVVILRREGIRRYAVEDLEP